MNLMITAYGIQLHAVQGKLEFVRNCLVFRTSTHNWPEYLLNKVVLICENALFVCFLCWWVDHLHCETLVADLLLKIQYSMPFIRLAYSQDLITSSSLKTHGNVGTEFHALGVVYSLHRDLCAWLKSEAGAALVQAEKDRIAFLLKELWFLTDFLAYATELGGLNHLLTQITSLADEVSSVAQRRAEDHDNLNAVITALLDCIMITKSEIRQNFIPENLSGHFPRTLHLGYVDFFLQNLKELVHNKVDLILQVKHEVVTLLSELLELRSFLGDASERKKKVEGLLHLEERLMNVSYKAEFYIDSITMNNGPVWCHMLLLSDLVEEIKLLKTETIQSIDISMHTRECISEITDELGLDDSPDEERVVGFDDEVDRIQNRLQRGPKHLDIVSIIGMPGLGKTTLARKLYKSRTITSYFHLRSWCCVSQVYTRRGLLLNLLDGIIELDGPKVEKMSDDDLAELLCKSLKGRRYLIVMDDVWSIDAWRDLSLCFPDQANGSRILLTSQVHDVSLLAKPDSAPINLRMFTNQESWFLLQMKLFRGRSCPQELSIIGEQIAEYCGGLPLSVVVVAGVLKDVDETESQWNAIADSVRQHTFEEGKRIMGVLELSYQHLPDHLKPCFLYFGIFHVDRDISVLKLVSLWIAEGLVLKNQGRNLEDMAEGYLKELVGRSLVIVTKRKSKGGIKTCRLHDLLLHFCLEKANEENFLLLSSGKEDIFTPWNVAKVLSLYSSEHQPQRICIHANEKDIFSWRPYNYPLVRSLLFFATAPNRQQIFFPNDYSFLTISAKLLRVLDLAQLNLGRQLPFGFECLVHLRYLAVRGEMNVVASNIVYLWNLETFLLKGMRGPVSVPSTVWKMRRLRHLLIRDSADFECLGDGDSNSFAAGDIESIATPSLCFGDDSMLDILARLPCLRKLRCLFLESWDISRGCNQFPVLEFLSKLESLTVFYHGRVQYPCGELSFPLNLKKLTLSKFHLPWSHISKIGSLPNLEVLKLLFKSFEGDTWDVNDEEFPSLKYLKLEALDITQWNAENCSDPFPCLEHLVLQRCRNLESIPSEIGYITTLQKIEMQFCSRAAAESAKTIQEEQLQMGNSDLQVHIHHLATCFGPIPQVQMV